MTVWLRDTTEQLQQKRLNEVLERFRTDPAKLVEERITLPNSVEARVRVLLCEINETILPRRIQVRRDGQCFAELDVEQGSIQAINRFDTEEAGQAVSFASVEDLSYVILEIAQQATQISTLPPRQAKHEASKVLKLETVSAVKRAICPRPEVSKIEMLVQLLSSDALSMFQWFENTKSIEYFGSSQWHKTLYRFAIAFRKNASNYKKPFSFEADQTLGILVPLSTTKLLVAVQDPERGIAVGIPIESGLRAVSVWQFIASKPIGSDKIEIGRSVT